MHAYMRIIHMYHMGAPLTAPFGHGSIYVISAQKTFLSGNLP